MRSTWVKQGLLDIPVLYLSSHIVRTKADYYRLLQSVREQDQWEEWVLYMLQAVETTAQQTLGTVLGPSRTRSSTTSTAFVPGTAFTART